MNDLIKIADKLLKTDGFGSTNIEQVKLFKSSKHSQRGPLVYSQGIIFLLQGEKHIYTESHEYSYDPENYIVITVPMPLECEGFGRENLPL